MALTLKRSRCRVGHRGFLMAPSFPVRMADLRAIDARHFEVRWMRKRLSRPYAFILRCPKMWDASSHRQLRIRRWRRNMRERVSADASMRGVRNKGNS